MGASHFVNTSEEGWHTPLEQTLDLIISTSDCDDDFPLKEYTSTLRPLGRFMTQVASFIVLRLVLTADSVGMPNKPLPTIHATDFLANGCTIGATHIGNRREALEMLQVAADKGVRSWINSEKMSAKGCHKVISSVRDGEARYRWVLAVQPDSFQDVERMTNGVH